MLAATVRPGMPVQGDVTFGQYAWIHASADVPGWTATDQAEAYTVRPGAMKPSVVTVGACAEDV